MAVCRNYPDSGASGVIPVIRAQIEGAAHPKQGGPMNVGRKWVVVMGGVA